MFDKVLVGIDEETRGRDAIALARRLVSSTGGLVLAHVHPGFPAHGKGDNGEFEAVEEECAHELLRAVLDEAGLQAATRTIGSFRVGAGLHQLAEAAGADLLVLGSTRKGRSGRVFLRDELSHAINGAPCAVAIAPLDYVRCTTLIEEIGVAYNGSAESRAALATAQLLATRLGASVSAFEALPLPTYQFTAGVWDSFTAAVGEREAAAREQIAAESGVSAFASCGETVDEIAAFSGSVDLLVTGARGYGPVGRLVHGSTTERLMRFARCPLLVQTRGARAEAQTHQPERSAFERV